jgi:hypothetical protein
MMIQMEINIIFLLFQHHEFIREPPETAALKYL